MSKIKNYPSTRSIKKTGRIIYSDDGVHSSQITVQELYNQIKAFMNKYSRDYEIEDVEESDVDKLAFWRTALLNANNPFISPISWSAEDRSTENPYMWEDERWDDAWMDHIYGAVWNNTGSFRDNINMQAYLKYEFLDGTYHKLLNLIGDRNNLGELFAFHFRTLKPLEVIGVGVEPRGVMYELKTLYKDVWESKYDPIGHWRIIFFFDHGPVGNLLDPTKMEYIDEIQDYAYVDVPDRMGYFARFYGIYPSSYGENSLFTELVRGSSAIPEYDPDITTDEGIDWTIKPIRCPLARSRFEIKSDIVYLSAYSSTVEISNVQHQVDYGMMSKALQDRIKLKFFRAFDVFNIGGISWDNELALDALQLNYNMFCTPLNSENFIIRRWDYYEGHEDNHSIRWMYPLGKTPYYDQYFDFVNALVNLTHITDFHTDNPALYTRDYACVDGILGEMEGEPTLYGLQLAPNYLLITFLRDLQSGFGSRYHYGGHGHLYKNGVVANEPEDYEAIERIFIDDYINPYCKFLYEQIMEPDEPGTYIESFKVNDTEVKVRMDEGSDSHWAVNLYIRNGLILRGPAPLKLDASNSIKSNYPALSFVKGGYNPQTGYLDGYSDIEDVRVNGVSVVSNHIADISFANVPKITELTLQGGSNTYGQVAIYDDGETKETDDQDRLHIYKNYIPNVYQGNLVADDDITIINGGHWSLGPTAYGPYSLSYMQVRSYEFVMLIFKVKIYSDCAGTFTAFVHDSSHNSSYRPFDPDSSDYDSSYTDFDVRYVPRNVPTTLEIIKIVQPTSSDRSTYTTEQYNLYLDHSVDTDDFSHTSDWTHGVEAYMHYDKKYLVKL